MARTEITFFTAGNRSMEGGTMPVPRAAGMLTEAVVPTSSSTVSMLANPASDQTGFARLLSDVDVWAVAGASPVASVPADGASGDGIRVSAGVATDIALAEGDRIAIITV